VKYQLVLQWPCSSSSDGVGLLSIEGLIEKAIGELGVVDGHDIGSGEMNVFVHTTNPRSAFEKAKRLLFLMGHLPEMKAGSRDFDEDDYTPIWPAELDQFAVK
jgi:hypothetical protein